MNVLRGIDQSSDCSRLIYVVEVCCFDAIKLLFYSRYM